MTEPVTLAIARYAFRFTMRADGRLPEYAGSVLRGAFGAALRRSACMTGGSACPPCPLWRSCPYPALFETPPRPTAHGQRFSQVPNPYVIEAPVPGPRHVAAGRPFEFAMVLIGADALRQLALVVHAWRRAFGHGIGPDRAPGDLDAVELCHPDGRREAVYDPATGGLLPHDASLALPAPAAAPALRLVLTTPLRIQADGHATDPRDLNADTLARALFRRLGLLLDLHLGRADLADPRALVAQAGAVEWNAELRWRDWKRYSARQQQEMTIGGASGAIELRNVPAEWTPWLWLGQWLHLGKMASFGLGGYVLEVGDRAGGDISPREVADVRNHPGKLLISKQKGGGAVQTMP